MSYYQIGIGAASPAKPTLRQGARGAFVMELQHKLGIQVDSLFGPVTLQAVKSFQSSHGLVADGVVGPKTWAELDRTEPPPAVPVTHDEPTIAKGSAGAPVIELQQRLGITTDGLYGPKTKEAVVAFQTNHGLTPDGVVGPKTWEQLSQVTPPPATAPGAKAVAEQPPARTPEAVTQVPRDPTPSPPSGVSVVDNKGNVVAVPGPPVGQPSAKRGSAFGLIAGIVGGGGLLWLLSRKH